MSPVPIAMCGKFPWMAVKFRERMLPEYDIVFHFTNTGEAHEHLPSLMRGEKVNPPSGVGTNTDNPNPIVPKALFVGGGFSEDELYDMMSIPEGKNMVWLAPGGNHREEVAQQGGPEVMLQSIVDRTKKCLMDHGMVEGKEDGFEAEEWRY